MSADNTCGQIENTIYNGGNFDAYDIRQPKTDAFPPETYATYLTDAAVIKAIGAKSAYAECSDAAGAKFNTAGDGKFPKFIFHSTS